MPPPTWPWSWGSSLRPPLSSAVSCSAALCGDPGAVTKRRRSPRSTDLSLKVKEKKLTLINSMFLQNRHPLILLRQCPTTTLSLPASTPRLRIPCTLTRARTTESQPRRSATTAPITSKPFRSCVFFVNLSFIQLSRKSTRNQGQNLC